MRLRLDIRPIILKYIVLEFLVSSNYFVMYELFVCFIVSWLYFKM